jgi:HSP20 family molecular chaperone IbpA
MKIIGEIKMTDYQENEKTEVKEEQKSWLDVLGNQRSIAPLVDIYETENDFVLVANLPGVSKENIHLKLEENTLSIFGKINYDESINRKYLLNENLIGNYYRIFRLSESIDQTKIDAKYENGQLFVNLPKHERIKPRTINID